MENRESLRNEALPVPAQLVPDTVPLEQRELYSRVTSSRRMLKHDVDDIDQLFTEARHLNAPSESIANLVLAKRHLEDASMRLGKVLQHLDGGVSAYDRTQVPNA